MKNATRTLEAWEPERPLFHQARFQAVCFDPRVPHDPEALPADLERAVPKRQAEYLAGRWCVRELYRAEGLALPAPERGAKGEPLWPSGWMGSITHTVLQGQGRAAAVLAPSHKVAALGVDLEPFMSAETAARVGQTILHPEEVAWGSEPELLTLIFSFKESLYKALNPLLKRFIGFQEVCLTQISEPHIDFEARAELRQDWPEGFRCRGLCQRLCLPEGDFWLTGFEQESLSH